MFGWRADWSASRRPAAIEQDPAPPGARVGLDYKERSEPHLKKTPRWAGLDWKPRMYHSNCTSTWNLLELSQSVSSEHLISSLVGMLPPPPPPVTWPPPTPLCWKFPGCSLVPLWPAICAVAVSHSVPEQWGITANISGAFTFKSGQSGFDHLAELLAYLQLMIGSCLVWPLKHCAPKSLNLTAERDVIITTSNDGQSQTKLIIHQNLLLSLCIWMDC